MAQANLVEKKVRLGHRDIIKFQLITQCFIKNLKLSDSELNCLTLLGAYGQCELSDFCNTTVTESIFKTSQTVRNFLTKAEKNNLVNKEGTSRKKISLNPELKVQTDGNIILDYKLFYVTQKQ